LLVAESGSQNPVIPTVLTSALHPIAAVGMVEFRWAADDPKRTFASLVRIGIRQKNCNAQLKAY
ncbi:MAG: hypothetical protein V3V96_12795, partial [Acidiferrobacterales bacterium]